VKVTTANPVENIDQQNEIMLASISLGISANFVELIPKITGDVLDCDELIMIYKQYQAAGSEFVSLSDWLIDSQFYGLTRVDGIAERKRLIGLGIVL